MLNRLTIVSVALFALLAGPAAAQCTPDTAGGKGPGAPTFAEFDLDGDGAITSEEYYQARGARMAKRAQEGGKMKNAANMPAFESIDQDGDGTLSVAEFRDHHEHHGARHGEGGHKGRG